MESVPSSVNRLSFDCNEVHFENSVQNPDYLIAFFDNVPLGTLKIKPLINMHRKKWAKISLYDRVSKKKTTSVRVSNKDLELVRDRSLNLLALMDVDFSKVDSPIKIIDRHIQDIGIRIKCLNEVVSPRTLFYFLNRILRLKIFVKNYKIRNEEKNFKEFILRRLSTIETLVLDVLRVTPGAQIRTPDILPISPLSFSSKAVSINYRIEEGGKKFSIEELNLNKMNSRGRKSAVEKKMYLEMLEAKLMEEASTSNLELKLKKEESRRIFKNVDGCVDFAFVNNEIGFAIVSSGQGYFRYETAPVLEKIWTEFFNEFIYKAQRNFSFIEHAKNFLRQQVEGLNKVFNNKVEAGSANFSFVWTVQTLIGEKFALIVNVGNNGVLLLKNKEGISYPSYMFLQPQPGEEFAKGNDIKPKIFVEEIYTGDVICLFSHGVANYFTEKNHLASFLDIFDENIDLETIAQKKIDMLKSKAIPERNSRFIEERSSVQILKGLKTRDESPFDDLSLAILGIK